MNSEVSLPTKIRLLDVIARMRAERQPDVMAALVAAASDPQALCDELAGLLGMPLVRLSDLAEWSARFDLLPFAESSSRRCGLLADRREQLRFVLTDPFDTDQLGWARSRFGAVQVHLASESTFDAWLAVAETTLTALADLGASVTSDVEGSNQSAEELSLSQISADSSPAVRFVNSTIYDALKIGASDIHLEMDLLGLAVKFRIDGVLTAMRRVDSRELALQSLNRIKVMAQLDIAERRIPQDGRLQIGYRGRGVDVRVSIMPSIHGEDAVLRILDREHLAQSLAGLTLAKLGFDTSTRASIHALCKKPHGMFLVTGPTGSGKTTTLYAAITETRVTRDKVVTIEDPVEYQLAGILQIPVNERKGLTFARGLRSILRHDPDKILVGEIRDGETAQIAVQAALTGHLVYTTVHANSVFDVVGRFEQFGIDAYTFASAVNGVLAQRLLRRLCAHCAASASPSRAQAVPLVGSTGGTLREDVMVAVGCEHCRGSGYSGRFALGELLMLTPSLKDLIARRAPLSELQAEAKRHLWRSLREQADVAVASGQTTLSEVDRVAA